MRSELEEKIAEVHKRMLRIDSYSGPGHHQTNRLSNVDAAYGNLLTDSLNEIDSGNVLEVGCGRGETLDDIRENHPKISV